MGSPQSQRRRYYCGHRRLCAAQRPRLEKPPRLNSGGALASCVVDGVLLAAGPRQDELRDGHKGIALLQKSLDDAGQGLRGVEGGVVEQDDGPGLDLGGHPLGDVGGGQVLPVQAVHIPLDGLHAHGPHGVNHVVVVLPVGTAEQGGPRPRHLFDLVPAGVEVGDDLIGRQAVEVGVGIGVAHHLMARVGQGLHRLGVFVHPLPHHKEGGRHVVLAQNVDELLGVLVAPG